MSCAWEVSLLAGESVGGEELLRGKKDGKSLFCCSLHVPDRARKEKGVAKPHSVS